MKKYSLTLEGHASSRKIIWFCPLQFKSIWNGNIWITLTWTFPCVSVWKSFEPTLLTQLQQHYRFRANQIVVGHHLINSMEPFMEQSRFQPSRWCSIVLPTPFLTYQTAWKIKNWGTRTLALMTLSFEIIHDAFISSSWLMAWVDLTAWEIFTICEWT